MDKEQIENEAASYVAGTFGLDNIGFAEAERAFKAGASWRINSVWHKPCDMAEPGKDCLVEHMDGDGNVCIRIDWRSEYEWVQACHYDKVLRWAYVVDLLPTETI